MKILIANIGSTSFKYRLLETEGERVLGQGKVERVGSAMLTAYPSSQCPSRSLPRLPSLG
mgnify:CR=1 FL=1